MAFFAVVTGQLSLFAFVDVFARNQSSQGRFIAFGRTDSESLPDQKPTVLSVSAADTCFCGEWSPSLTGGVPFVDECGSIGWMDRRLSAWVTRLFYRASCIFLPSPIRKLNRAVGQRT